MRRTLLACLLLLAAAPAASQPVLYPGQRVASQLSADDPTLSDGSHYDLWQFQALAGHVYLVTMRSSQLDAYLAVGASAANCTDCSTDDDGAGGNDAAVRFTAAANGTYQVRANSYNAGETGRYEITLADEGPGPDAVAPAEIRAGDTVEGRLEPGDVVNGNRGFTDTFIYNGRAGETLVVTLRSADFDAVVAMGRPGHRGCRPIDSDDDGGEGTDSRLQLTLRADGTYHVHVRTARPDGSGAYTLTVERR
ncbi:MAG TPA: PPC domain-containing protein [Armatimonadota bacterium]|nr:PPC domain-containing protein [Armatimonadota bacterium]